MQIKIFAKTLSALVMTSLFLGGCSFFGPKGNSLPMAEIVKNSKTSFAESLKKELADTIKKSEENFKGKLEKSSGSGDMAGKLNLDLGETGKISVEVKDSFKISGEKSKNLEIDSNIFELAKSINLVMEKELIVKTENIEGLGSIEVSAVIDTYIADGVLYVSLKDVNIPENIPGVASKTEIDAFVTLYKNKWFKIDLNQVYEENPMLMAFFSQKLNNLNGERVSELIDLYVDQVFLPSKWLTIDESSKTETDKGDEYSLIINKEGTTNFIKDNFDFAINNAELVDSVFDLRGTRNPFLATIPGFKPMTIEELKDNLKAEKEAALKDLNNYPFSEDLKIKIAAAGDKVSYIGYQGEINENDSKGSYSVGIDFLGEKTNFENFNFNGDLKVNQVEGDGKFEGMFEVEAQGKDMEVNANLNLSAPEVGEKEGEETALNANLYASISNGEKGGVVNKVEATFNFKAKDIAPGINGLSGELDFRGGDKKSLNAKIEADPKEQLFLSAEADLSREKGKFDAAANINIPDLDTTFKGDLNFNYNFKEEKTEISAPENSENAEDLTAMVLAESGFGNEVYGSELEALSEDETAMMNAMMENPEAFAELQNKMASGEEMSQEELMQLFSNMEVNAGN